MVFHHSTPLTVGFIGCLPTASFFWFISVHVPVLVKDNSFELDGDQEAAINHQAYGRDRKLSPPLFLRQHSLQMCGVLSLEDCLATRMPVQFQRPVPLEPKDGARIVPAGDYGGDLPAAVLEPSPEPLDIHITLPCCVRGMHSRISLSTSAKRRTFRALDLIRSFVSF